MNGKVFHSPSLQKTICRAVSSLLVAQTFFGCGTDSQSAAERPETSSLYHSLKGQDRGEHYGGGDSEEESPEFQSRWWIPQELLIPSVLVCVLGCGVGIQWSRTQFDPNLAYEARPFAPDEVNYSKNSELNGMPIKRIAYLQSNRAYYVWVPDFFDLSQAEKVYRFEKSQVLLRPAIPNQVPRIKRLPHTAILEVPAGGIGLFADSIDLKAGHPSSLWHPKYPEETGELENPTPPPVLPQSKSKPSEPIRDEVLQPTSSPAKEQKNP